MKIKSVEKALIPDVIVITPEIFEDDRGYFYESYNVNDFKKLGLPTKFVQENQLFSKKGVLRGLHFQIKYQQGKLVRVVHGEVFDVAVDIRLGSPTFRRYVRLSDINHKIMYVPEGFAHGYLVLSETAIFQYKCTEVYHPEDEYGIIWNDSDIEVNWPIQRPNLSLHDKNLPNLKSIEQEHLPKFKG